jgi:hypothetical protein
VYEVSRVLNEGWSQGTYKVIRWFLGSFDAASTITALASRHAMAKKGPLMAMLFYHGSPTNDELIEPKMSRERDSVRSEPSFRFDGC